MVLFTRLREEHMPVSMEFGMALDIASEYQFNMECIRGEGY